jgi:hypothetical protein
MSDPEDTYDPGLEDQVDRIDQRVDRYNGSI